DAIDAKRKLLGDLVQRDLGNVTVAAPLMREQTMGVLDGALAALDGYIHALASPRRQPRGSGYRDNLIVMDQHDVDPARKQGFVDGQPLEQVVRLQRNLQNRRAVDAGAAQFERGP